MNIGNAIRFLRKKKGLTQGDLASMTGITQANISLIENDTRPSDLTMKKICEALDIPVIMVYIYAFDFTDVSADKTTKFEIIHPIIKDLVHQLL